MELITFPQTATLAGVDRTAPYRWSSTGIRSTSGETIRLAFVRRGRRLFTSREALEQFLRRVEADRYPGRHDSIAEETEAEMRSALNQQ